MQNKRDYYDILGIAKNATEDEIKKAYKKLAREHHPDMVKESDKIAAEARFKEINEAYQILSDPQKRSMYDQVGHAGPNGFGGGNTGGQWGPFSYSYSNSGQGFEDINPFDVFEELFGFRGFGGQTRSRKGKNLYYELHISFADAVHGTEKTIKTEAGELIVKIPKGMRNGVEMRFAGKGMPGPKGAPAGDVMITFVVNNPKEFDRDGDTLGTKVEIDFVQAILGDIVEIPVIDETETTGIGKAKFKIPAGTQTGTRFNLKGKGMPKLQGTGFGNLIVQVEIKIPKKVSKEQKALLEEYKKTL